MHNDSIAATKALRHSQVSQVRRDVCTDIDILNSLQTVYKRAGLWPSRTDHPDERKDVHVHRCLCMHDVSQALRGHCPSRQREGRRP